MRVDDSHDRSARTVGEVEVHAGARGGDGGERVDDDDAAGGFDDRHVGERETADLIDAVGDFEEAVDLVELRLPPQTGIDGGGRLLREERVMVGLRPALLVAMNPRLASSKSWRS